MYRSLKIMAMSVILFAGSFPVAAEPAKQLQFRVLLDDKEIGVHTYSIERLEDAVIVQSRAEFEVKFLFFSAFNYRHTNLERWSGDCLEEIDARTVSNSKTREVRGEQTPDGFVVQGTVDRAVLPECVMSFAYWNPLFHEQSKLLNPQTGELLDVEIEKLPRDSLSVRGEERAARAYRVRAKDTEVSVWYSGNDEWLALESTVRGGRIIRYELI